MVGVRIKGAVYRSEQGRERKANEDGLLCMTKVPLFAVADGHGGPEAAAGALLALKVQSTALRAANKGVSDSPSSASRLAVANFFESAFDRANRAVAGATRENAKRRLHSSLVAATVVGPYAFVGHVGDSRAYLLRNGELRCLTNDHTIAALQLRRGDISAEEFLTSPFRKTLSQALGTTPALEVDVAEISLKPGDMMLLCSNGLTKVVDDTVIARAMYHGQLDASADRLMTAARKGGAPDNVTVVLIATEADARDDTIQVDLEANTRATSLFAGLNDPEWVRLAPYLEHVKYAAGETVCARGDDPEGFIVVASGRVMVRAATLERWEVGPSGAFGALCLTHDGPVLDSAKAIETSHVFILSRRNFKRFTRHNPALGVRLTLDFLQRIGERLAVVSTRLATIDQLVNGEL